MDIGRLQIFAALAILSAASAGAQTNVPDFGSLSLDQLANIKVTSFTKKQQNLSQVAGAVYVITQEQIARSGLTSVPELLRLAPGIDVERVNGNQWSISARGTVGVYSNKLQVLIDGRSIYTPVFAGVYWEIGMPPLDDIDRIEVIRGPGATLWGANAVLGVINIITKSTRDTLGTTVTAGAGNSDRGFGDVRTGGTIGSMTYRGYFGGSDNAPLKQASGANANDAWSSVQGGFRLEGSYGKNTWKLTGDLFRAAENETGVYLSLPTQSVVESPSSFDTNADNITGELRRHIGETGELRVQTYYDYVDRPEPQAPKVVTHTWDTEIQYDFKAKHLHNISIGAGERLIDARIVAGQGLDFSPSGLTYSNADAFAQDEMHFLHDTLLFTIGAKLEHNHFGGWGTEPSANLLWMPSKHNSIWISTARSLRTPTQFDRSVQYPFSIYPASPATEGLPILVQIDGSPTFAPESVKDYEVGYRTQVTKKISLDLTAFYDQYSSLRSWLTTAPAFEFSTVPYLQLAESEGNFGRAVGKGAEASAAWEVLRAWKLEGSYTYNSVNPYFDSSAPTGSIDAGGKLPSHNKWRLQSYVNLSKAWKFDEFLYWTSQASPTNTYGPNIPVPSYLRFDLRLGYKINRQWDLSLAGQNLLEARHLEGLTEVLTAYSYVSRGIYLKSTWKF